MATIHKLKQHADTMEKPVVIGANIGAALKAIKDHGEVPGTVAKDAKSMKRSGKARVLVQDGKDFTKMGKEAATTFLSSEEEIKAAIAELNQQARVTRGTLWLAYAMEVSTEEQAETMCEAFGAELKARKYARATADAADFRAFVKAYLVSSGEVVGALAECKNQVEAFKAIRCIRDNKPFKVDDDGNVTYAKRTSGAGNIQRKVRTLGQKSFDKVIQQVARMNAKQLTRLFAAGKSRAAVLRKKGEVFEAFK